MAKTVDTTPRFTNLLDVDPKKPIGMKRPLTILEDNDLGILGIPRSEVKHMRPGRLQKLAESSGADMSKHVGS